MKIVIDGLTEDMVDALCRKWMYPETVMVEEPFDNNGNEIMIDKTVDNPQSREDFVKQHVIGFVTNEYRLVVRQDEADVFTSKVEEKVKKAKLK